MGYESVREMEKFLLEGQEQALELTTQGISSILGNRTDLFDPEIGVPELIGRPLTSLLSALTVALLLLAFTRLATLTTVSLLFTSLLAFPLR